MSRPFVIDRATKERREMNDDEFAQREVDQAAAASRPSKWRIVGYKDETVGARTFRWPMFSVIEYGLTSSQVNALIAKGYDVEQIH